jgi:hypothetical protein
MCVYSTSSLRGHPRHHFCSLFLRQSLTLLSRLASNEPPISSSQVVETTGVYHHAWLRTTHLSKEKKNDLLNWQSLE